MFFVNNSKKCPINLHSVGRLMRGRYVGVRYTPPLTFCTSDFPGFHSQGIYIKNTGLLVDSFINTLVFHNSEVLLVQLNYY